MSQSSEHLQPLDLNPWRVLVIAAHPGDIECNAVSALAAKWTDEGAEVIYLLATRGELSMPGIEPSDAALIRSAEASAAASAVGVQIVDFLDLNDGSVEANIGLRRSIVRDIRNYRPDVIVTLNHRNQTLHRTINDPDHRAVGIAALDAVAAAANQWAFRDTGQPHQVETVLIAASAEPTHAIDVSKFGTNAIDAFAAHKQQLSTVAGHAESDPNSVSEMLRAAAERLPGASAAITVERIEYGQGSLCHSFIVGEFSDPDGQAQTMKMPEPKKRERPTKREPKAAKGKRQKPQRDKEPQTPTGAMKFKGLLEQAGRTIGVEVPSNVMERLDGTRPRVLVEVNGTTFEASITVSNEKRFIAINAARRKAAGIEVGQSFFLAVSAAST